MIILHRFEELPSHQNYVFGIGFFDGCHVGHQAVFQEVKRLAKEKGALPCLITFFPHPMTLLAPAIHVSLLQSEMEKMEAMKQAGIELVLCIRPSHTFLSISAESFLQTLKTISGLKGIVTGANFTFGKGALGNSDLLTRYFQGTDVTVHILPLETKENHQISSTDIRKLILSGHMEEASALLGRNYTITGDVVHGFRRGHTVLGFPTANLDVPPDRVIPIDGVYATYAVVAGRRFSSITNVGNNPTFGNTKKTIETFIFDFDETIYGKSFTLEWVHYIRGEITFSSVEALISQIQKDIQEAKRIL